MSTEKYQQIVDRLAAKTDRRELDWKESAEPNTFQVSLANFSLTLSQVRSKLVVSIINFEGTIVDSFSDEDLDASPGGSYYKRMNDLYQKVRRQALGVDKALDELLNELEDRH